MYLLIWYCNADQDILKTQELCVYLTQHQGPNSRRKQGFENKNAPSVLISTHCVQSYEKTTKRTRIRKKFCCARSPVKKDLKECEE